MNDNLNKQEAIRRSALWAAYGDALGFITELADKKSLKLRTDKSRIITTIPWKQKIGGQLGVIVELPTGCYSDDTQLRLATCRAIRGDGRFDVEAFAKVELPVWLSYALGAGRGTKTAAASMTRKDTTWANNFFDTKTSSYVDCGGNGAATRIQPHVWAASDLKNVETFIPDVLRNTVCTHGHPRGILGAVFHSLCLAHTLHFKKIPSPDEWRKFIAILYKVPQQILNDPELVEYWLPAWDKNAESNLESSCKAVAEECLKDIGVVQLIRETAKNSSDAQYATMAREIGGMSDEYRGAGTKTAILAVALAWMFKSNPRGAIEVGSNLLGSDTDTISSMAGAIVGSVADYDPPGEICDETYIEQEAFRMSAISNGLKAESFIYPDLFNWDVGSVQSDFVKIDGDRLVVSGLGYANAIGELYKLKADDEVGWQWLQLNIGQKVLAKRRLNPDVVLSTHLAPEVETEQFDFTIVEITEETISDVGKEEDEPAAPQKKQPVVTEQTAKEVDTVTSEHLAPKIEKEKLKAPAAEITQERIPDAGKEQEVKPVAPQKQTVTPDKAVKEAETVSSTGLEPKIEKEKPKAPSVEITQEKILETVKVQEVKSVAQQKHTITPDQAAKEADAVSSTDLTPKIEKEKLIPSSAEIAQERISGADKKQEVKPVAPEKQIIIPDQAAKEADTFSSTDLTPKIEKEKPIPPAAEITQEKILEVDKEQEVKPVAQQKQTITPDHAAKELYAVSSAHLVPEIEKEQSKSPAVEISQETIPEVGKEQEVKPAAPEKQAVMPEQAVKEEQAVSSTELTPKIEEEKPISHSAEIAQETIPDDSKELETKPVAPEKKQPMTLDQATKEAINSGFDPALIGRMLLEFSERNDGVEMAIGFSAIIAKIHRATIGKL